MILLPEDGKKGEFLEERTAFHGYSVVCTSKMIFFRDESNRRFGILGYSLVNFFRCPFQVIPARIQKGRVEAMILAFPDRIPANRKKRTMIPSRNRLQKRIHFFGWDQKMQEIKPTWPKSPPRIRGWVKAERFFRRDAKNSSSISKIKAD